MTKEAENIIGIIDRSDISEYELAQNAGISRSTINSWRNRDIRPDTRTLKKVCRVLGVSFSEVAGDETKSEDDADWDLGDCREKKKEFREIKILGKELVDENKGGYAIAFMKFLKKEGLTPDGSYHIDPEERGNPDNKHTT